MYLRLQVYSNYANVQYGHIWVTCVVKGAAGYIPRAVGGLPVTSEAFPLPITYRDLPV